MDVIQYKCPNCGGDLKFDPASGKYTCEYCRGIFSQDELDKQTDAKMKQAGGSAESASSADNTGVSGSGAENDGTASGVEDARVYTCPSCGATIVTDATTAATFCYYCHNPVVLSGRLDGAYKPDYVAPFKIDRRKAESIFEEWIAKKKYVPKYFYSKDQIEKFTGVYFPYFVYSCNIKGNLDVEAAKKDISVAGNIETTDEGVYHVVRKGDLDVKNVLHNALRKANKVLSDSVLPFETDELKPFNMSYLSGFFAEKRDIERREVEAEVKKEAVDYAISKLEDSVAGYTDITVTADHVKVSDENWAYALLPVWTLTYNDNGKIYYFSINGQTGRTVGELPVDRFKLLKAFMLILVPLAVLLLLFFYFIL